MSQKTEAERKRDYQEEQQTVDEIWAGMGPTPDFFDGDGATFPDNLSDPRHFDEWGKIPPHLVKHDLDEGPDATPYFDDDKHKSKVVTKASTARTEDKAERAAELKYRYPDRWGKRGQAKVIWGLEKDFGNKISVRTIQKYFKEDRDKNRIR